MSNKTKNKKTITRSSSWRFLEIKKNQESGGIQIAQIRNVKIKADTYVRFCLKSDFMSIAHTYSLGQL